MRQGFLIASVLANALLFAVSLCFSQTDAPEADTVPAVEQKTYDKIAVVRTSYATEDGSPGRLHARLRLASWISLAEGYELHPNADKQITVSVENVNALAGESQRFKDAVQEWFAVIGLVAKRQYYQGKIDDALDADPGADVSALQASLDTVETALQIQ
jgi:protein involved in sex pheromone biosynthesis